MAQPMVAAVQCPACQGRFRARVETIIDVRADPSAKGRVMNGAVNVATCPQCGGHVLLNVPFLYHDAEKELALVYAPAGAGLAEPDRQKAIGRLTRAVMDSLPPEERKGYLLQPQEFLALENLVKKVLHAEGITPQVIAEQKAKGELLQRMVDAEGDEALEVIVKENDAAIDSGFLRLLAMNLEAASATGRKEDVEQLVALRGKVLELSTEGQAAAKRAEMVEALRQEPKGDKLLELLIEAPDEVARGVLVSFGLPLMDYSFFTALTSRIDATADGKEKKRLTGLRSEILEIRDGIESETRALWQQRAALLRDLMLSDDAEGLARRRYPELDDAFFKVLAANLEEARTGGDEKAVESLTGVWNLAMRLMEESLPPELRLFNRLVAAKEEGEVTKLLEKNRRLVTASFVAFLVQAEKGMRENESEEMADHVAVVLAKAREMGGEAPKAEPEAEPEAKPKPKPKAKPKTKAKTKAKAGKERSEEPKKSKKKPAAK